MTTRRGLMGGLMCAVLFAPMLPAWAQGYAPRQYYGGWVKHTTHRYHFRRYYYKPTPTYVGYRHHYVIHHPARPKHLYFYNPYKRTYWGRCEVQRDGRPLYSMLAEKDRKATLNEIPEAAFPPPSPVPPIPESEDSAPLDLPPDDLPDSNTALTPKDE